MSRQDSSIVTSTVVPPVGHRERVEAAYKKTLAANAVIALAARAVNADDGYLRVALRDAYVKLDEVCAELSDVYNEMD
ncbi:MAG: hypothetical protein ABUS47_16520 [Steroidobacter sp.]